MRRVVVTGLGAVTPIGLTADSFWQGLTEGRLGIKKIQSFDTTDFPIKIAGEIIDYDPLETLDKKKSKRMDRISQFATTASIEAFAMAGLTKDNYDPDRAGVMIGNGIGGLLTITTEQEKLMAKGPSRISPFFVPAAIGNMPGGNVAIELNLKGPNMTLVTACASSTNAIGEAFHKIKFDMADIMLAGGTEASLCPLGIGGFASMSALSDSDDPTCASIPFDKNRSGFVMGEGAGILVLEELEHAKKRGAKIFGEICGYSSTCDAYHITAPETTGRGASLAMKQAIEEGGIDKEDVDYINAHGTSTPFNDVIESRAIQALFGEATKELMVSSTKSMTGHLLGAAGAVEAIACIKALETGIVPPTIGVREQDPECNLDIVAHEARRKNIKYAMSNSLGFGGHNSVLLMKRWEA
ncbi:beta-ketoacyl-ACP synthase II [Clostridia bacterium]|nr:beta-ketoacyl-ACP synthase II [Clostridia bacterium]